MTRQRPPIRYQVSADSLPVSVSWKSGSQDTFLFSRHPRTSAQTSNAVGEPAACGQRREEDPGSVCRWNSSPWAAGCTRVGRRGRPRHRKGLSMATAHREHLPGPSQPRGGVPGGSVVTTAGPARRGRAGQAAAANTDRTARHAQRPLPTGRPPCSRHRPRAPPSPLSGWSQKEKLPVRFEQGTPVSTVTTDWALFVLVSSLVSLAWELPHCRQLSCTLSRQPGLLPSILPSSLCGTLGPGVRPVPSAPRARRLCSHSNPFR